MKVYKDLHHTRELLRLAKAKPDKIKKDGAPKGRPTIAYRGGLPLARDAPTCRRRMGAKENQVLFADPSMKHHRDGPPFPLTPSIGDEVRMDVD